MFIFNIYALKDTDMMVMEAYTDVRTNIVIQNFYSY